ncbi:MAG: hypothetical protein J6D08_16590 [Lachnospiraceae bacterium]|nr:hypothetical protein [Lachnospiraceae bacterium]
MLENNKDLVVHDIVLGKFLKRLLTQYKDEPLSDAQLCTLYRECDNSVDITEILDNGTVEELP